MGYGLCLCNYFKVGGIIYKVCFFRGGMEERMKERVKYFYKNKTPVHITKKNGFFFNGLILEFSLDLIIIDDLKVGAMPIYFEEILEITKQREERNDRRS